MKLEAPLTLEIVPLNDWSYYSDLSCWQVSVAHLDVGWPPILVVKVLGFGFRAEARWEA